MDAMGTQKEIKYMHISHATTVQKYTSTMRTHSKPSAMQLIMLLLPLINIYWTTTVQLCMYINNMDIIQKQRSTLQLYFSNIYIQHETNRPKYTSIMHLLLKKL